MATPLQPVAYELVIDSPEDPTINEIVKVYRDNDSPDDWLAKATSIAIPDGVTGAGNTPEEACKELARTLRVIADRIDPVAYKELARTLRVIADRIDPVA